MNQREKILECLNSCINANKPIVGVAVGAGIYAKYAEIGGADMIFVFNSGRFRLMGLSSTAGFLPFENSNELVMNFGTKEIITAVKKIPVIFGLCATDPTLNLESYIEKIHSSGFAGINNYPTVGLIDGIYRLALEETGMGFNHEVRAIELARKKDIFTVAFVFTNEQAVQMASVGADVICAHLGFTRGGYMGAKSYLSLEKSADFAQSIFNSADSVNKNVIKLIYGGPVTTAQNTEYMYENTDTMGYIGGSTFERIPTETAIKHLTEQFKNYHILSKENSYLKNQLLKKIHFDDIVGKSRVMQELYSIINKVAEKNINALILGESGTGKELVAQAIHKNSDRATKPFIKVNCAAIPENLLESEFFGYEQGAFTGAKSKKIGRFELADKGTLFLDEIAEIPLNMQAKLLRAIQQQEFERVGGIKTIKVDVRIIAATNRDLQQEVDRGNFRNDLYYRLNVISIYLPPLRERKDDLIILIKHLLDRINEKLKTSISKIDEDAIDALMLYDWPGNVRELENALERAAILSENNNITLNNLPANIRSLWTSASAGSATEKENGNDIFSLSSLERNSIIRALQQNNWNVTRSAEILGISRKTLQLKIKKYNLKKRTV